MEIIVKESLYTKDCIRTVSGRYINVFEPTPEMICIEDIAHALSMQPRFGGHLPTFYSVAQHSVLVSELVDSAKLTALMHDASEAYLLDVPRPIKLRLANYKEIENGLMEVLAGIFSFAWPLPVNVKAADEEMLQWEWDNLMLGSTLASRFKCWSPEQAKSEFIKRFNFLS